VTPLSNAPQRREARFPHDRRRQLRRQQLARGVEREDVRLATLANEDAANRLDGTLCPVVALEPIMDDRRPHGA
jgi:hypothetical protein